jgi:hypothetical protein
MASELQKSRVHIVHIVRTVRMSRPLPRPDHPAAARRQVRQSMRRFRSQGVMESRLSPLRRESAPDP